MLQGCCSAGGRSLKLSEFPETFISWLFKTHCCVLLMVAGSNMKADKPSVTSLNPSYKNRGNSGITACGVTRFPTAGNVTLRPCVLDSSTPLASSKPLKTNTALVEVVEQTKQRWRCFGDLVFDGWQSAHFLICHRPGASSSYRHCNAET